MANGIDGQIHIEVGPVEVVGLGALDICELGDWSVLEPRKLREGYEQFLGPQHEPEAVIRDVRNFNVQSACARQHGCHVRVSGPMLRPLELILRQFNGWLKPELRFPIGVMHVHMEPGFLAREEKETETVFAKDSRAQGLLSRQLTL